MVNAVGGLFSRQAEKYAAFKAKEQEREMAPQIERANMLLAMRAMDDETFCALALSDPTLPRDFLKTSEGVSHFLKRFFMQTTILFGKEKNRHIEASEQWTAAVKERGASQEPIDLKLRHVWLSDRKIVSLAKLFPNVRSIEIDDYFYQHSGRSKEGNVCLDLQTTFLQNFKKIGHIEMSNGRSFAISQLMGIKEPAYKPGTNEIPKSERYCESLEMDRRLRELDRTQKLPPIEPFKTAEERPPTAEEMKARLEAECAAKEKQAAKDAALAKRDKEEQELAEKAAELPWEPVDESTWNDAGTEKPAETDDWA